ncbi:MULTISPECIES: beta-ketoacyl-ACP synthase II [Clostridium]|uniref:beta-ketoacyl-ACP synthase II n=1 Tax=Clostridium TaxID=1485 RepID=UPI0018A0F325|nr:MULTISPECIES: beta-ketoacyl-ACP synthase II [Clostridium]MBS7131156.1 beta-ketoacyl-ACP synthase II [Clostridium sp.]MDB2076793.1 beta-ketoacyl-ACP synthase II [Clostridium paraputrificum]MDB2080376.1 beta-ketoacyl-ACP synthase II [Clostridium paraputrificum]MDB2093783.1 beta-ketoacyl-ACP synthase II [Clostridium paraputrificum]MDB2100494.1 beta-ketoacyl-ACP synthase II [Clostridium paraputrificum]
MSRKVVVTGMGAVTPIGNNVEEYWNSLKNGKSGIDYIKNIDTSTIDVKIGAEVKEFHPEEVMPKKEVRRLDKFSQFVLYAADEAIKSSGLDVESINSKRFGVYVGSGIGGFMTMESETEKIATGKSKRVSPFFVPMTIINLGAGNIAIKYGAKGPCTSMVTACATGNNNIGEAFRLIKDGYADVMLAGSGEAPITKMGVAGFASMKALNSNNDISRASIPFDKDRSGFVIGEGGAVLVLESEEHAISRGAKILAEIVGYGSTCDAYHITCPHPEGEGAADAMIEAIEEAGIERNEVSYINAHGTSTPLNDKYETYAIKKVFNDYAYNIPVSSTKSMTGHLLGGAGSIEAVACIKALQEGFIPPTIGLENVDEELDLDYVPNKGREKELKYVLSNSLGFGGHNATLLFKKWE